MNNSHIIDMLYKNQVAFKHYLNIDDSKKLINMAIADEFNHLNFNERLSDLDKEKYVGTTKKKYILIGA